MEEKKNYTAKSSISNASDIVSNAGANVLSKIGDIAQSGENVLDTASNIMKLTFSAIGITRYFKGVNSENKIPTHINQDTRYDAVSGGIYKYKNKYESTKSDFKEIYDNNNDYVFKCGDYFLPLSFSFSASANTNIVRSQLVGGIQIIENTFYEPHVIDMRIKIERKPYNNDIPLTEEMNFRNSSRNAIIRLGEFLRYLRKEQPVFEVDNNYITKDLGVRYCTLLKYNIIPTEGSDITLVNLTLLEVDLTTQTLFIN